MATLTSSQLTALADNFLLFAQAVGNYRYVNSGKLNDAQNTLIKNAHYQLLDFADDLYTASAKVSIDDADGALKTIEDITQQMNDTYQFLAKVQKAIDVATAGLNLGTALFSKDPQAIATAVSGLAKAWKEV